MNRNHSLATTRLYSFLFLVLLFLSVRASTTPKKLEPFHLLSRSLYTHRYNTTDEKKLEETLKSLSKIQSTFKTLDGISHETYQRTHSSPEVESVRGRATRRADRIGCLADSLFACELLSSSEEDLSKRNYTVWRNATLGEVRVCILWDADYRGDVGSRHGGIHGLTSTSKQRGRILILLRDSSSENLSKILKELDVPPLPIELKAGLISEEVASVHPSLYKTAGEVVKEVYGELMGRNASEAAIHFVGRGLAGGVAALAAFIADGALPMPLEKTSKKKKKKKKLVEIREDKNQTSTNSTIQDLSGVFQGRVSCTTIGPPPCISPNIHSTYITSLVHGDDILPRITHDSLQRLYSRIDGLLKKNNLATKNLALMGNMVELTLGGLKKHAHGSAGEEIHLALPGKTFIIKPRRYHNVCSMHEIGEGREAIRAKVLWQMDDVLLSGSLWSHHGFAAYVRGMDRVEVLDPERDLS